MHIECRLRGIAASLRGAGTLVASATPCCLQRCMRSGGLEHPRSTPASGQQTPRALSRSSGPCAARPPPPSPPSARRPGRAAHPAHPPTAHPPAQISTDVMSPVASASAVSGTECSIAESALLGTRICCSRQSLGEPGCEEARLGARTCAAPPVLDCRRLMKLPLALAAGCASVPAIDQCMHSASLSSRKLAPLMTMYDSSPPMIPAAPVTAAFSGGAPQQHRDVQPHCCCLVQLPET